MNVLAAAVASVLAAHTAVGFTPLPRFAAPLGHSPRVASAATPAASSVAATLRFRRRSCSRRATEDGEDLPASSDIDWDKEWSKVARGEVKASEPGLEPPSEIQKAQYKGAWLNPLDVDDAPPPAARTHLSTYATGPLHSAHRPTLTPLPPLRPSPAADQPGQGAGADVGCAAGRLEILDWHNRGHLRGNGAAGERGGRFGVSVPSVTAGRAAVWQRDAF